VQEHYLLRMEICVNEGLIIGHILEFAIEGRAYGLEEEERFTHMKALSH
jgi:hypothetical protein